MFMNTPCQLLSVAASWSGFLRLRMAVAMCYRPGFCLGLWNFAKGSRIALRSDFIFDSFLPPAPARIAVWSTIRAGQHLTGRKIEQSCGASASHRFADEATRLCAIPGVS